MKDRIFWIITIVSLFGFIAFAGFWLVQNIEIQKAVILGNEQQAINEAVILKNQTEIKKTLDSRTPLIEKIKVIEDKQKEIIENQHVIHELRQRIEELEKNQRPESLKKRIDEIK